MSGRDHSETCEVCGFERGGMNDQPCKCDCPPCPNEAVCNGYHGTDCVVAGYAPTAGVNLGETVGELRSDLVEMARNWAEAHEAVAQLRADLARVTAERDDLRARCKFQDQRIERAIRCSDRLVDERDSIRADLARVTAERDALARIEIQYRAISDRAAAIAERDAIRAKLEAVTAERDAAVMQSDAWESVARERHATLGKVESERDALRALPPTEVEREALDYLIAVSSGAADGCNVRAARDTALAYLDRLLGGGR